MSRRWGVYVFHNARWVPMFSLGIHVDFHTPRVDLHLPFVGVSVGRIVWQSAVRFVNHPAERWNGHTDDCWHREAM